ncbi:helix-turn-helix domain-containing protein [Nocardioides nanhaiensis]|uniref:TetR/AcrR family transcriptional regulator n=1 Tax=Nocardioides nanhaiensis TaxID=1476871 RepID=A0ABP8VQ88_9ACTN
MASLRHNTSSPPPSEPGPRDGYLDAARACLLDVGWRRTTLTEVARRAGVSRMTIYRTWNDMPQLLGDLMTREWSQVMAATAVAESPEAGGDAVERIADGVLAAVRALRGNELFVRIVEVDPELVLPYLLHRRGRSQDLVLAAGEEAIAAGQRAGRVRAGEPVLIARALLLALHGFVISAHTMVDDAVSAEALEAELRHLVRAVLAP